MGENPNKLRALAFATALDREDYPAARELMADQCTYLLRGAEIHGADAIVESYRSHGGSARDRFDEVTYKSEIEMTGPRSALVHYTDLIGHCGDQHMHRCRQHLEFDQDGLVSRIVHEDLPGEAERLAEFEARHS